MKVEVWIDYQDDDTPPVIWKSTNDDVDAGAVVIPAIGEKVGIRPFADGPENTFYFDYVIDVVHYFLKVPPWEGSGGRKIWKQEIHILTSSTSRFPPAVDDRLIRG